MHQSDLKVINFVSDTLIKLLNLHRDSRKSLFQIKVPVAEAFKAYEIIYKKKITIGDSNDKEIIQRFENAVNEGMNQFEVYCKNKNINITKVRLDDSLYYEYQTKKIKVN